MAPQVVENLPDVPQDIQELAGKVRHIVLRDGEPWLTRPLDHPFMVCRMHEPGAEKALGYRPFKVMKTFHRYGWHVKFNPTFMDVLGQIPKEWRDRVAGFEILVDPTTTKAGLKHSFESKYHTSRVRLYEKK